MAFIEVGKELNIPVYLYEKSAKSKERIKLPSIRAGEYEGLSEKILKTDWKPDYGPSKIHTKAGAVIIGCRDFLIAYNINLNTKDHRLATDIAFELREAGRSKRIPNPKSRNLLDGEIIRTEDGKPVKVLGLFKDVKAIGWYVDEYKRAQISINFNNYKNSSIHHVFDQANKLANERGVRITGSELVGLVPLEAMLSAGKYYLKKLAEKYLSKDLIYRDKFYFPVPPLKILEGKFLNYAKEILLSKSCSNRGLYNQENINTLLLEPNSHFTKLNGNKVWHLALLERWFQLNIDA